MSTESADEALVLSLDGMYCAYLDDEEQAALSRCIKAGVAMRDFGGPAGMLGLSKVLCFPIAASGNDADARSDEEK